jgi:hypothetical protein
VRRRMCEVSMVHVDGELAFSCQTQIEIPQTRRDTERRQAHVLQHIDLADPQSS